MVKSGGISKILLISRTVAMTEQDGIILGYLRRISEQMDEIRADAREINSRLGALVDKLTGIIDQFDRVGMRLDQIDTRLERIEGRLERIAT